MLGTENQADIMVKNLEAVKIQRCSEMLQQSLREGRAQEGLKFQQTGSRDAKVLIA